MDAIHDSQHNKRHLHLRLFAAIIALALLLSLPTLHAKAKDQHEELRLLIAGDPFALAILSLEEEIEETTGFDLAIEVVGYTDLLTLIVLNSRDLTSNYDIVAFDSLWVGEIATVNALLPLNDLIDQTPELNTDDFLKIAFESTVVDGIQFGLPIQPHPEILWYRQDWFDAAGIAPPQTTDDMLIAAEALTDAAIDQYGICFNGQRGQPLGQQMANFYAAFGQPLLDDDGQPTLDTPDAVAAATFVLELSQWAPPDITSIAWDQRIIRYRDGGCAMTYGWAARTILLDDAANPSIVDNTGFIAPPFAAAPVTPLGVWSLGIPANIGERERVAWEFLVYIESEATLKQLAEYGNGGMPRYAILRDDRLIALYPAFPLVDQLYRDDSLQTWMRPAVPQWTALADILGTVYHDMLRGLLEPEEAAREAQRRAEALFEST